MPRPAARRRAMPRGWRCSATPPMPAPASTAPLPTRPSASASRISCSSATAAARGRIAGSWSRGRRRKDITRTDSRWRAGIWTATLTYRRVRGPCSFRTRPSSSRAATGPSDGDTAAAGKDALSPPTPRTAPGSSVSSLDGAAAAGSGGCLGTSTWLARAGTRCKRTRRLAISCRAGPASGVTRRTSRTLGTDCGLSRKQTSSRCAKMRRDPTGRKGSTARRGAERRRHRCSKRARRGLVSVCRGEAVVWLSTASVR
mmetsp:Transcript_2923/g.6848  ORF Transcript_2923/g.6848 Transcript_2923/m.6848 type:complete len:257 (+) Transcript_2923:2753-3523(+)